MPAFTPKRLPASSPACVIACGAWLKNTACLLLGDQVWLSPVHGDLSTPDSRVALHDSVQALVALATAQGARVEAFAHDLHPDFYSTQLALQWADKLAVPAIGVQHHHAHVAVVQAEQPRVSAWLGLALDGVGLGIDGTAWGGELLLVQGQNFERLSHLPQLVLAGGDVAAREAWRMTVSMLHNLDRSEEVVPRLTAVGLPRGQIEQIQKLITRGLNCPVTTSAGRWFDAVSALLGLCTHQTAEAQAAMALEACATDWLAKNKSHELEGMDFHADEKARVSEAHVRDQPEPMNLSRLMAQILRIVDAKQADWQGHAAAIFHHGLAAVMAQAVIAFAWQRDVHDVALTGGCFYNRLLREQLSRQLELAQLQVHIPQNLNCGDAGLCLGQAWIAAHELVAQRTNAEPLTRTQTDLSTREVENFIFIEKEKLCA